MTPTLAELLADAEHRLASVTETPRLDAEILAGHLLSLSPAKLRTRLQDHIEIPQFESLVARRLDHEPIAYILGEWEFYSLPIICEAPILVPRPETEHVVEAALEHIGSEAAKVLDLCTGTGCIAIAIAKNAPKAEVVATDLNPQAAELAVRNARNNHTAGRVVVLQGDLFNALPAHAGPFDVIVSNPPYVEDEEWGSLPLIIQKHEDPGALLAGPQGLDVINRIAAEAPKWLRPGGLLAIEIGMGQDEAVGKLLQQHGYADIAFKKDLAGIPRVATAHTPR